MGRSGKVSNEKMRKREGECGGRISGKRGRGKRIRK